MHSAAAVTIGELMGKLIEYGKTQREFSLTVALDANGDYSSAFIFGREAEDSPMASGASYGYGGSVPECLKQMIEECGVERRPVKLGERNG
jgi:hypothetical protein